MRPSTKTAGLCQNILSVISYSFEEIFLDHSSMILLFTRFTILLFKKLLFGSSGQHPNKNSNVLLDPLLQKSFLRV